MSIAQMLLGTGAAAGGGGTNIAFDPTQTNSNVTLSASDRTATRTTGSGLGGVARATIGKSSGKWYTEFLAVTSSSGNLAFGLVLSTFNPLVANYLGGTAIDWGYWSDGSRYLSGSATGGHASFTNGDVIGMAWDATAGKLWWAKNNTWQSSGDPAAGTSPGYSSVSGTGYPAADCFGSGLVGSIRHAAAYSYSPPSGFSAWE